MSNFGTKKTKIFISVLLFSAFFLSLAEAKIPIGFTIYSATEYTNNFTAVDTGSCENSLESGVGSFDAVTFNVDYRRWHQGDPENPLKTFSNKPGYLHVEPASNQYKENIVECLIYANALGYSPVALKIMLMDYIDPNDSSNNVWRAKIKFNPLNGTFSQGNGSPVDLAESASAAYYSQTNSNDLIVSVNDEYIESIKSYPFEWSQVHTSLMTSLSKQSTLAVNIDWNMLYSAPASSYGSSVKLALSGVDLIGWSLYKPFFGTNYDDIKNNQKDAVQDLRTYLDDIGLRDIPMTIFEFGVRNRFSPWSWDSTLTDLCDQSTAYHAWIELLQNEETSTKTFFNFWFGDFDPRDTASHALQDYKSNYKVHPDLSQCY